MKSDRQIILRNNTIGWHEFIQNVPLTFKEFDFECKAEFLNAL